MTPRTQVLLVSTPVISGKERFYIPDFEIPLNVCYLAASLEAAGIPCEIADMNVEGRNFSLEKTVLEMRPAAVGFAAYTPFIHVAHKYAQGIKKASPDIKTIIGGYHASALPEETLREFPFFDYLVRGEGETTLTELVNGIAAGRGPDGVAGVFYRDENGEIRNNPAREQIADIDSIPFPARRKLDQGKYRVNPINYVKLPTTGILASRGCEKRCAFCSQSVFRPVRVRSAANIVDEMRQCATDFGMRGFRFYDDNLAAHRETCMEFCAELRNRNLNISWNCFSRVDSVDPEMLREMKSAGCHQIKFGVETGTEKMLVVIKKGITLEQSREAIRMAKRAGIESQVSLILGLPGETEQDMRETIRFISDISPDLAGINLFKPMPGSPLFRQLERDGKLLHRNWPDYSYRQTRPVSGGTLPQEELERALSRAYLSFFLRPRYILLRMKWFFRQPRREALRVAVGLKYMFLNIIVGRGEGRFR
jgi:anaerobic magnesium-protoporphyrin IX monomethyl ester cyclase